MTIIAEYFISRTTSQDIGQASYGYNVHSYLNVPKPAINLEASNLFNYYLVAMLRYLFSVTIRRKPCKSRKPTNPNPAYLVKWEDNDPLNPQMWSDRYKWWVTFQLAMLAMVGSLGSSITTSSDNTIAKYVGVSSEAAVLDLSLYL
jgi:hypothetical protein